MDKRTFSEGSRNLAGSQLGPGGQDILIDMLLAPASGVARLEGKTTSALWVYVVERPDGHDDTALVFLRTSV